MAEIYFAWVEDLYVAFNPAVHAIVAEPGVGEQMHTVKLSQEENAAAVAELTFPNPGVGLLSASRRRFVLISESETGDPADAVLQGRGRITALPTELQSTMITVEAICGPEDLEDRQRAYVTARYGSPWTDRLYGDKPDDVVAFLNARGAVWYIDPVTHGVSISDIIEGGRAVDIGANHVAADFLIKAGDAPVKAAKLEVVVDWEQSAEGWIDIADSFPDFGSLSAQFTVSMVGGLGWEVDNYYYRVTAVAPVAVERGYLRTTKYDRYTYTGTTQTGVQTQSPGTTTPGYNTWEPYPGDPSVLTSVYHPPVFNNDATKLYTFRHNFTRTQVDQVSSRVDTMQHRTYEVYRCRVSYGYRQQRRETITLTMVCPVQDVLGTLSELDMGTLVLDDPTDDFDTPVWYPGMAVVAGEYVLFESKRWLVTETHDRDYFYFKSVINGLLTNVTTPGFAEAVPLSALDRKYPNLVGRPRGTAAVEHALMLMSAALRWRLRGLAVTVRPGDWATMRGLTLDDELACSHPRFGDIRGKVTKWTRIWAGSGRFGSVELGVALGTGADAAGQLNGVDYAIAPSPVAEPVIASGLSDRLYSVADISVINDDDAQGVLVGEAIARNEDPTNVVANNPTSLVIQMRDLTTTRIIERKISVTANIVDSPRGFDTGV